MGAVAFMSFLFFLVACPRRATVIPARVPWLLYFWLLLLLLGGGGGLWFGTFRKIRETPKGGCFRSSTRHPGEVARENKGAREKRGDGVRIRGRVDALVFIFFWLHVPTLLEASVQKLLSRQESPGSCPFCFCFCCWLMAGVYGSGRSGE